MVTTCFLLFILHRYTKNLLHVTNFPVSLILLRIFSNDNSVLNFFLCFYLFIFHPFFLVNVFVFLYCLCTVIELINGPHIFDF